LGETSASIFKTFAYGGLINVKAGCAPADIVLSERARPFATYFLGVAVVGPHNFGRFSKLNAPHRPPRLHP
jgi:hypothetical protein